MHDARVLIKPPLTSRFGRRRTQEPTQLPKLLAENLRSIDQRLFLRLAEMSDAEEDDFEKLRIRQLATLVASTLETLIEQTDAQMDADATVVQELLQGLADDSGEFELPVPAERLGALRESLRERGGALDEGFVATVKAYMRKASDDGLDGMVDILRVLLQAYAAERLRSLAGSQPAEEGDEAARAAVVAAFEASPAEWDQVLRAQSSECGAEAVVQLLQDKMGEVVLSMPAGSAVQTVLAEYLNELMGAARAIAAEDV